MNLKIRPIIATGFLALSTLAACAGGAIRSYYKKNDVQPVKVEKAEDKSLKITYRIPAESLFYSPGVDYKNDHGVLRIAIRRCVITDQCDAVAKAAGPAAEPWKVGVTVPYGGKEVVLVYADTEETFHP
ncbi:MULTISPECIES: hypothetical protein [Xanthomonas]|uniref:hypothetical protein n=1 Tax=Xanthomonas TaxID=338 RepID=UPI001E5C0FA6|nr:MULTISPECIES: hypothetical protein [Xanthomonas]UIX75631.1 hypothetical protein LMJ37_20640 [Xanthomonas citri pv. glycines]WLA20549.1 hypothetical protein NDK37_03150 [Xanthomonas citri pv. glycines]WLA30045.1 hypothetical protein NPS81_03175 [Xanthomonas citri pv. glycines]